MEKNEFLTQHLFTDLKNLNETAENAEDYRFSEEDFSTIIERAEHLGIGFYTIETKLDGEKYASTTHEDLKKKATDPSWYKKAFLTFKSGNPELTYSGTYKISMKLLAKDIFKDEEE
ncbi:hypothetical protein EAX61_11020 [Dokdonia sinensis]|uniref:Uncharacterized protein n=1 Tax=Dokdonia sinensis TaxID=2479847 RepID=A0A3M0GJZ3_9FLAO|nr:hypothetical protein [Dokdonia sinensis]RMB57636.1 hypothetical protein EAX61_11020 [Dokdonia sinensis]